MTPEKLIEEYTEEFSKYTSDCTLLSILEEDTFPNLIKEAVEMEKQRWLAGGVCRSCGDDIVDSGGLLDMCGKCF